jgi:hypothetical protein
LVLRCWWSEKVQLEGQVLMRQREQESMVALRLKQTLLE